MDETTRSIGNGGSVTLPLEALEPDPLNSLAFEETDCGELEESIRRDGFLGEISAYPIGNGKYRVESGHRRLAAAAAAGLKNVQAFVTEPPKDEEDRRLRLAAWNLHSRPSTPLGAARLAEFLFVAYSMRNERLKREGLPTEPILDRIASDMECSKSNVSKYRMLLSLSEGLQKLVRDGVCPWASAAAAASLSPEKQESLRRRIVGRARLGGKVTSAWLDKEIKEYRAVSEIKPFHDAKSVSDVLFPSSAREKPRREVSVSGNAGKRIRRRDGAKAIRKAHSEITEALGRGAFIKGSDEAESARLLRETVDVALKALERYDETGTFRLKSGR